MIFEVKDSYGGTRLAARVIYFSSRDKGFEKGQFVWKGGIRVESVSYPRTADTPPSMFLPLGFIWAPNSV